MNSATPVTDINEIVHDDTQLWKNFQAAHLLVTGATGFIGRWFVEVLSRANRTHDLSLQMSIVVRNPKKAREIFPKTDHSDLIFIHSDLASQDPFEGIDLSHVTHILHGATSTNKNQVSEDLHSSTVLGLRNIIQSTTANGNIPRLLNLSSGAVYGESARRNERINDDNPIISSDSSSDKYAKAKVDSEMLVEKSNILHEISGVNARLFSFVGPHIPVDSAYAVPNFISDAIAGRKIRIGASAETTRSYLYPSDLIASLLRLFNSDFQGSVNVGSRISLNMFEIATAINQIYSGDGVEFINPKAKPNHYVPGLVTLDGVIGKQKEIAFEESILKWKEWLEK
jgi:nucleoside-diphosphate-sugar epimerase